MIFTAVHVDGPTESGTGFMVTVPSRRIPDKSYGYVITAHHVIQGQNPVMVTVPSALNGELYPPVMVDDWRQPLPKVDLALAPFGERDDRNYFGIPINRYMLPKYPQAGPNLGAPIYYIGLFVPAWRMMARAGTVGALDVENMKHGGGYEYTCHLIDCRSYDGFSGSPVFVQLSYSGLEKTIIPWPPPPGHEWGDVGRMYYVAVLCGMFTAHYSDEKSPIQNPEQAISRYGVGVMVMGDEIQEALMTKDMKDERDQWDAEAEAQAKAASAKQLVPKLASAKKTLTSVDDLSRSQFDDALGRATRKVTPPDESAPEG